MHIKELTAKIDTIATKSFPYLSISEKCITTESMTYIIETGHGESFSYKESEDYEECGI